VCADTFEPVRLEFYVGKLFIGQDIRGTDKSYGNLKRAYQIAILANERFFNDDIPLSLSRRSPGLTWKQLKTFKQDMKDDPYPVSGGLMALL
jgi:hypothetical protein